ncbi:MAG: AAA family ATPase [Planctomycetes bacterium]|nr:AAA family ATPase [Planctomycetota bacterium]
MKESILLESEDEAIALRGSRDRHVAMIRDAFRVEIIPDGTTLRLSGEAEPVARVRNVIARLCEVAGQKGVVRVVDVEEAISGERRLEVSHDGKDGMPIVSGVVARTGGQAAYVRAMRKFDLVFCIGPAGTGKTYLAVAAAVAALKENQVRRIVLARPAVEAGEKLGYLPGDMHAKVNPYLMPLYDALRDIMGVEQMTRYIEHNIIEISPLAYMRGRTLNDAFAILDEAQNCTKMQMKMFLTRLGMRSRSVVTGDISQVDLPSGEMSGLMHACSILGGVRGAKFIRLGPKDIVRHRLVQDIVDAYDAHERGERES